MKKLIFSFFNVLILGLLLTSCVKEDFSSAEPFPDPEENTFPYHITEDYYNDENTYYLLNDSETPEFYLEKFDVRGFYTDEPLQMTMEDGNVFQIRFYSPRALPRVVIWAKIDGYDEQFKLMEIDKLMPFQQLRVQLPFADEDVTATTRDGRKITIMANPYLLPADFSFEAESDAPYWQTLRSIKVRWKASFSQFPEQQQYYPNNAYMYKNPLLAYQAREAVGLLLNMACMFSSDEFRDKLYGWGDLIDGNSVLSKDDVYQRATRTGNFRIGNASGVQGSRGSGGMILAGYKFYNHYVDDECDSHYGASAATFFHEFGHMMGYSHNGNMTYESSPGWVTLCHQVLEDLSLKKKLPVYSRRFLHTRRKYTRDYYVRPYKIIEDPELDALDGGLGAGGDGSDGFLKTDWGETANAAPLSFRLDYNDAGAAQNDYAPRSVYVYGDKLYLTNNIRNGSHSLDIFDLSTGRPKHEKRVDKWVNPDGNSENLPAPLDALRSNGKLYLSHAGERILVFDAQSYQCLYSIGRTSPSVAGLAAADGAVYGFRSYTIGFLEHVIDNSQGWLGTPDQRLPHHADNSMTADYDGNVYSVSYNDKKLIRMDTRYLKACKLSYGDEMTLQDNPLGAAWSSDGRLFVSFDSNGSNKFCEVDPRTGAVVKDCTTIGGITLKRPTKCIIRRGTLFIVDRDAGALYAIPMNELNK